MSSSISAALVGGHLIQQDGVKYKVTPSFYQNHQNDPLNPVDLSTDNNKINEVVHYVLYPLTQPNVNKELTVSIRLQEVIDYAVLHEKVITKELDYAQGQGINHANQPSSKMAIIQSFSKQVLTSIKEKPTFTSLTSNAKKRYILTLKI